MAGCKSFTGSVTISAPATVTVPSGAITKTFWIKTVPVATSEVGLFSATLGSSSSQSQSLKVRPIGPVSVTLLPNPVVGGKSVVGTAKLECNAGPGPVKVALASSNTAVARPVAASIYVPQGLQSATFAVVTSAVLARTTASIYGTANGITKARTLTVTPAASVSPTSLKFGSVTVGQTSAALTATLTNKGAGAFSINRIMLTGTYASWFAQAHNCPASLAAGAYCTIRVTFRPLTATSRSAKLSIETNATSTPLTVALAGTGL